MDQQHWLFDDEADDEQRKNAERIRKLNEQRKAKQVPPDDLSEGRRLRDEGMEQVLENEGDDWKEDVIRVLSGLRGQHLSGEGIRRACAEVGVYAHHPNCWGGFCNGLVIKGVLRKTGGYTQMTAPTSHGRETKVYLVL